MATRLRTSGIRAALSTAATLALIGLPATAAHGATATPTCTDVCLLDVRTGAHTDFDRLVFDLSDGMLPNVTTSTSTSGEYILPNGNTMPLTIKGNSYLFIDMNPVQMSDDSGSPTFTSPTTQTVALPSLQGIQLTTFSEGEVEFGVSLGTYSRYEISHLTAPNREIIDIYH